MRVFTLVLLPSLLIAGQPRYARMGEFQGSVEVQLGASEPWMSALRNLPLVESAWIRCGPLSRAEIELDEGSSWRLGPDSQAGIADYSRLSTGQRITLLSLDRGLAYFTGHAEGRDSLVLVVPGGELTVTRGARVRLEAEDRVSSISILAGMARFSSPAAEMDLREGQTVRVEPARPARFFLEREVPPMELDRWNEGRDHVLASSISSAHVAERFGLSDLDTAGEWVQTEDLGAVWKPKVPQGWSPFQKGRWIWYDRLGYTWVGAEDWSWLPYHYGRWLRKANLGWIWAPAQNSAFKPGDVYWLRGTGVVGWGPLGPGEVWKPGAKDSPLPQEFLEANTTYAPFPENAAAIDPHGFTSRPKDPLRTMAFAAALPSPPLDPSKLEWQRPFLNSARGSATPYVDGTTFDGGIIKSAAPAPTVIITQAAPSASPDPVAVPYPVPVEVPSVLVVAPPPMPAETPHKPERKAQPVAKALAPAGRHLADSPPRGSTPPSRRDPRKDEEDFLVEQIARELAGRNYSKALADLDRWSHEYPDAVRRPERHYYYVQAYNGLNQPAKVVDTSRRLLENITAVLPDSMQVLTTLYLTVANFHKLPNPTREQSAIGRSAALELIHVLPVCFASGNRPASTSVEDWRKARSDFEILAKTTIAATEAQGLR